MAGTQRLLAARAAVLALAACAACSSPEGGTPSPPSPSSPPLVASPLTLPETLPEVIATVNGTPIPLRHARIIVETALGPQAPTPAARALEYHRAMEQLIVRELLRQEAEARKIQPDAAAVERVRQQVRSEHATEADYAKFLADKGLDEKSFREELRVRNVVEKVVKAETETVPATIPEPEARQYYASNQHLFESAGRPLPFEEVRERVQQQVVTFKRQEALNALLVRLRSSARIEKFI